MRDGQGAPLEMPLKRPQWVFSACLAGGSAAEEATHPGSPKKVLAKSEWSAPG